MIGWGYPPQVIIVRRPKRRKARYHSPRYVQRKVTYKDIERTARLAKKTAKISYAVSKKAYVATRPVAVKVGRKAFAFAKWGAGKVKERYRPSYEPGPRPKHLYEKYGEKKGFFSKILRR